MKRKFKNINGILYKSLNGVLIPVTEAPSSREKSWITIGQIGKEYPEWINKISEILYYNEYNSRSKDYARSILNYLSCNDFVSWKQFDSIVKIYPSPSKSKPSYQNSYSQLEQDDEVYTAKRRSDGSTGYYLPSGDEQLSDYVHFGINFKGLRI